MDQLLLQRLDILKEAGEIDSDIKDAVVDFATGFEKKYEVALTEENASMLITHLAMALSRIRKGDSVDEMDELALNEVKQYDVYQELDVFYKVLEDKLKVAIPESEQGFIALHATALINKLK